MRPIYRLILAAAIAFTALVYYRGDFNAETFALDPAMQLSTESWKGVHFSAPTISLIKAVVAQHGKPAAAVEGCTPFTLLWLGNSQLHYINQFKTGDHIAPYWMRSAIACPDTTTPLGISLPNAGLQEHYALASYAVARLPLRMILLELCFDDLREDGLRGDFSGLLEESDRQRLKANPTGRDIMARAEGEWGAANPAEESSGLEGFVQKGVEDRLDAGLGEIWPLWASRPNLRGQVLTDLYYFRNAALGIKATTVRKMIGPRYIRNMAALTQLLDEAQSLGILVVAYIAPIRQDMTLPYDLGQYTAWKKEVADLRKRKGATLANLETLVPDRLWGTYHADDVDFMHFRGEGHKILAKALLPYVQAKMGEKR